MTMDHTPEYEAESKLAEVHRLLAKHRMLESVARRQETPRSALLEEMQHRQNLVELHKRLRGLHPADIANLLESLPPDDRAIVWTELPDRLGGEALVEVSSGVRAALIEDTSHERLTGMLRELDADDLRYLSDSLPDDVLDDVSAMLDARDRSWVEQSQAYPENSAARLMTQDLLSLRESQTIEEAVSVLRRRGRLPHHTDRLFVVDSRNLLIGAVPLDLLVIAEPSAQVGAVMDTDVGRFRPDDEAEQVATAFERYDLLSAPIVDDRGKLIGRVTADAVMDFIRSSSANEVLALAGLRKAEDLFAPVRDSARNRWPWLAVNLATAFIASRVIGAFEEHDPAARRARRADADRGQRRRQHRQPDRRPRRARSCARSDQSEQLVVSAAQGDDRQLVERRALGDGHRAVRDDRLSIGRARRSHDERRSPQSRRSPPLSVYSCRSGSRDREGIRRRVPACS